MFKITQRPCPDCGRIVPMFPKQLRCNACSYEKKLQRARERYYENKTGAKMHERNYAQREVGKNWPVKFLEKDGGFIWQVTFLNPLTKRMVTIGAAQVFADIDKARADYVKAMR